MNSNQPKPAPTAPREYVIPDEESLPKYFKEPAPTAEEQPEFPPLDDTQKERDNSLAMMPDNPKAALYRAMCTCRERQLLAALVERDAALRSNREKDAQLERERSVWCDKPEDRMYHAADRTWWKRVEGNCVTADAPPLLAEKEAKIAELTEQRDEWETHAGNHVDRIRRLEFSLRAVSEALKEKLEPQRATHEATLASIPFYWASEVDARDARLRSIVDGKD